jgi:hypothetical protein
VSKSLGLLIVVPFIVGASCTKNVKDEVVLVPQTVNSELLIYVPIPPELTDQHAIAEGPLSEIPRIARERKAALIACNADKAEIASIQGTRAPACPVPPQAAPAPAGADSSAPR